MAVGSNIVLNPNQERGVRLEGTISGTPKPGTCMEIVATALVNGRPTYRVYQPGTDGEQRLVVVLDKNPFNGQLATDAYADGDHGFLYCPLPGEELNMLVADVSGTGDDHAIGDVMMIDSGTGLLIITTGSPEMESFVLLEAATDPTAAALMLAMYTGH